MSKTSGIWQGVEKAARARVAHRGCGLLFSVPVLFCLFFIWFYQGHCWYPAATLSISGSTIGGTGKALNVWWNSGNGLNEYERRFFAFEPRLPNSDGGALLRITRTGTRNPASAGTRVVVRAIMVDGRPLDLEHVALPDGVARHDGALEFEREQVSLSIHVKPLYSLRIELQRFNYAGEVDVQIGDESSRYDLYASNDETQWGGRNATIVSKWFVDEVGRFTVYLDVPRYPITSYMLAPQKAFNFTSVTLTAPGDSDLVLPGGVYEGGYIVPFTEADHNRQRHYHPHWLVCQLVLAAAAVLLVRSLLAYGRRFRGIRDLFINDNRSIFWLMTLCSCAVFGYWHLSVWPAIMSNDSLEVWRAAHIPGLYLGDHPPLNVICYLMLSMVWDNPAVVALTQNVCTSLLIAYIFFHLYRRGLRLWLLVPCFALVVCSVPIGLYTAILWKDVPFALIAVLLGFELSRLVVLKRNGAKQVSGQKWLSLFILTAALIGFRHNGILYVFIVPGFLLLFGIVQVRLRTVILLASIVVAFGLVFFLSPRNSATSGYLIQQTRQYLDQALNHDPLEYAAQSANDYLGILDINQNKMQWDLVHLCMYGRYTYSFIKGLRWNDIYPYLPFPRQQVIKAARDSAWFLYMKSLRPPWVYLSWNPVFMLVLLPFLPFFFRCLPMTAVFGLWVLVPVALLVFLGIFNWRYYYFAYVSLYFLIPMAATDLFSVRRQT